MNKIWLCGITTNRIDDIREMTECYDFFDGLNFVDGGSTDGTLELLEERKKEGVIFQRPWVNDHSGSMNEFLRQGSMKNGDWMLVLDSPDRINPTWLEKLKGQIKDFEKNSVGAVSMAGKIYLARYFDHLQFLYSPHWALSGIVGQILNVDEKDKSNFITSVRFDDPVKSGMLNPAKYYYVYGVSNHCQLLYGKFGSEITNQHEAARIAFRLYCEQTLGLEFTLDSLVSYMEKYEYFTNEFINFVENEVNMKDLFRLKVLKQDFVKEIDKNRINWSLKEFLKSGDKDQFFGNTDYVGPINIYRRRVGLGDEQPCFN